MKNEKWNMKEYILVLFLILVMILHFIMEHILTSKISCSIFIFGLKQFSNDLSFQSCLERGSESDTLKGETGELYNVFPSRLSHNSRKDINYSKRGIYMIYM
ncbi:hypothetical protein H8356DRAFT_1356610 [Neocallimastix lanati (nom. inval.)]|nr:hypothetical protein H8356DRAFT_1356610 [Neocallimastix sp. JGI-2020a]